MSIRGPVLLIERSQGMAHRYRVGQMLEMLASPMNGNRPSGTCQVIFCLPRDSGPYRYRVKPLRGGAERIVDEIDLSPSKASAPALDDGPIRGISVKPR